MGLVISEIGIDCSDPHALAGWWAQVLDWVPAGDASPDFTGIRAPDGSMEWTFARVPEKKSVKNRWHVDLRPPSGSDQATELARLIGLGATPVDLGQGDVSWHVLSDPEGNEFCLLRDPSSTAAD